MVGEGKRDGGNTLQDFFIHTTYDSIIFLQARCHNWINIVWWLLTQLVGPFYSLG